MNVIWKKNQLFFEHPEIFGVSIDSRTVKKGDLFIALKGRFCDGHDFVKEAIKKGAACALVEREICENNIVVPCVMQALKKIASVRRKIIKSTVIAITGSVGKTTTRSVLYSNLLDSGKSVFQPQKNFNNLLGVCLTLAFVPLDKDFVILEVATSDFGEIAELSSLVEPDYGVITHIAPVHIQNFDSLNAIVSEKSDLIRFVKKKMFLPKNTWYSQRLTDVADSSFVEFEGFEHGKTATDNINNICSKVLNEFRINKKIDVEFLDGRRKIFDVKLNNVCLKVVDSSYSSNPSALIEELKFLKQFDGIKYAVLGDMLELGRRERRYHEFMNIYTKGMTLFLIGKNMKHLHNIAKNSFWFASVDALIKFLLNFDFEEGVLLVKGSNVCGLTKIIEILSGF